jgi:hypothetical protein
VNTSLRVLFVLLFAANVWAQPADPDPSYTPMTPGQHRAKFNYTRVQPLLDVPMIDAAITRCPDGCYYLGMTRWNTPRIHCTDRTATRVWSWRNRDAWVCSRAKRANGPQSQAVTDSNN